MVRHGELASVVERRATQIRHVLRDGPPDSEEDTPPAVRVRRGDLDPFALQRRASAGTSSRVDAGRGPSRLSKRGEKHANRDRHVVWRDERTTEGDPEGFGSRQRDGTGVVNDRSPSRLRRGIATRTATRTSPRPSRTFTTTHRPRYSPHPSSRARARRLARAAVRRPRFPTRSLSRMSPSSASASSGGPLAGRLRLNAHASAQSGVDAAREALDDVARDLRDAHERSAEKMPRRASHGPARTDSPRARRATGRPAAPHRRARGGGRRRSRVGGSRGAGARRPGRARRGAARGGRGESRGAAREERAGQAGGGGAGARARGGGGGARGGGDGAARRRVRPRPRREKRTTRRAFSCHASAPSRRREKRRPRRGVATRDAVRASGVSGRGKPRPEPNLGRTAEPLSHAFRASRALAKSPSSSS